jgi:hypothetical protein
MPKALNVYNKKLKNPPESPFNKGGLEKRKKED